MRMRDEQRWESRAFSVFIGNIPVRANWRSLWAFLEKRVDVVDVSLSKKKETLETRFAFVRFKKFEEASWCVRVFQNTMYLGNQLVLSHAVDGGRRQYWQRSRHEGGSSAPSGVSGNEPLVPRVMAVEEHGFVQALRRSVVGKLPVNLNFSDVHDKLCSKRHLDIVVRILSEYEVLVEFISGVKFSEERRENFPSLGNVFDEIRCWFDAVETEERNVWLCISGLPFRFWGSKSFENIAKLWGELIGVSAITEKVLDLRVGYIQIRTRKLDKINEEIELCSGSSVFKVNISETPVDCNLLDFGSAAVSVQRPVTASGDFLAKQGGRPVGADSDVGGSSSPGTMQELRVVSSPQVGESVHRPLLLPESIGPLAMDSSNESSAASTASPGLQQNLLVDVITNKAVGDFENNGQFLLKGINDAHVEPALPVVLEGGLHIVRVDAAVDSGPIEVEAHQVVRGSEACENGGGIVGVEITSGLNGSPAEAQLGEMDDDPFGLMDIIIRLNGGKNKLKKQPALASKAMEGDHLGWVSCSHVAMVEFGPSDSNLDEDCDISSSHLAQSKSQSWSKLFSTCSSVNQSGANLKPVRVKKGCYGIIGSDRAKAFAYAGKVR